MSFWVPLAWNITSLGHTLQEPGSHRRAQWHPRLIYRIQLKATQIEKYNPTPRSL